jgi:fatty acid desaturase
MTAPPAAPPPGPGPSFAAPEPEPVPIGEAHVDDESEESTSLRDPSRRLSRRSLLIIVAALWLAALITLAVVLWLWYTPPLNPVRLS